jgi:tRNA splicing endonuclease
MIRKWNYKNSRESKKSIKIHGKFIGNFVWIFCKSSIYKLWNNKFGKFGKGNLSRSEPFFGNPNPCFDSVGRAGRENKFNRNILTKGWEYESLQLNLLELLFLIKIQKIKISTINKFEVLCKILVAIDCNFYWNFIVYNRYKKSGWSLKSGIKYGGNFIAYKSENFFFTHRHSKAILLLYIPWLSEKFCTKCIKKYYSNFHHIQNKTRLAQQVSKHIIYLSFSLKVNCLENIFSKQFIFTEIGINRWVLFIKKN